MKKDILQDILKIMLRITLENTSSIKLLLLYLQANNLEITASDRFEKSITDTEEEIAKLINLIDKT